MIDDIYINLDSIEKSIYYPASSVNTDKPSVTNAIISEWTKHKLDEFAVDLDKDGVFRCRILKTVTGNVIAARKHEKKLPELYQLGLPFGVTRWLSSPDLCRGGLVAIVGTPGSGKSTTCAAAIISRLAAHGGVCITIEDPPEFNMQGRHNNGVCWQIPVTDDKEYHDAMKGALRGYPAGVPTILMMGEIRDPTAAASVLNASIDGRLVFVTLHASDTKSALGRLRAMSCEALGTAQADFLIAESLRGVLHQKLQNKKVEADLLVATDIAKATIRTGRYEHLVSEMDRQRTQLSLGQSIT